MSRRRIGFLGGGQMGGGIIRGLIDRGVVAPDDITVAEIVPSRREELRSRHGVRVTHEHHPAVSEVDAVVVAVKPQDFASLAESIRSTFVPETLVISIMAGVRVEQITSALPTQRAVRVMPNLGATVGESFSVWYATPAVTEEGRELVRALLQSVGLEREVSGEGYLDMATAVAGSGPGYVTLLIEAMIDGAVQIGLPRDLATEMVMQTVLGTVRWAQSEGAHPAELRARVVSPGGTTAEGVLALERGGARAAVMNAVIAGYEKSKALGR